MRLFIIAAAITFLFSAQLSVFGQAAHRDYLTDGEIEMVRDAQEIDLRIEVLVYAIDRRLTLLKIVTESVDTKDKNKKKKKEVDDWGPMPEGTKLELLSDIKRILQKAIDDIDSLAERPDSAILPDKDSTKIKSFDELFSLAVRGLASAATRYQSAMKKELDSTTVEREKGLILDVLENCDLIIQAVAKLPTEVKKSKK